MDRPYERKKKFLNLISIVAMALIFAPGQSFSETSGRTTVSVQVQPEAYMEMVSSPAWKTKDGLKRLSVPVQLMIRLNSGTIGNFSISLSEVIGAAVSPLEVETETGIREITDSPVLVRTFSHSGIYNETVVIQQPLSAGNDSLPTSLTLGLTSSDGTAAWSQVLTLPPDVPPAQ